MLSEYVICVALKDERLDANTIPSFQSSFEMGLLDGRNLGQGPEPRMPGGPTNTIMGLGGSGGGRGEGIGIPWCRVSQSRLISSKLSYKRIQPTQRQHRLTI